VKFGKAKEWKPCKEGSDEAGDKETDMPRTRPDIAFVELPRLRYKDGELLGAWDAIPLQPVVGPRRDEPSKRAILTIYEQPGSWERFTYKTLGASPGGNRYHGYHTLEEAQAAIQKWAKSVYWIA
jgi:hypothetical protein